MVEDDRLVTWCEPPFALVLDVFSSHREQTVKDYARNLGIELIFVPASGTGIYQPLDRVIFGIFKKLLNQKERISI